MDEAESTDRIKSRTFTGSVLAVLAVFGILVYVAGFSLRQSMVLAVMLQLMVQYVRRESAEEVKDSALQQGAHEFTPYRVRINPKWQKILMDFRVIASSEDWEQLKKPVYEALPYGISYTVLQPLGDDQQGTIFRSDRNDFFSDVEFRDTIRPITFEETSYVLRLFMTRIPDGYELGIIVPEKWWTRIKETSVRPMEQRAGEAFYEIELAVATLPYAEFDCYRKPVSLGVDAGNTFKAEPPTYRDWFQQITSRRDEQRSRYGWNEAKVGDGPSERIEHKYFEVTYERI